MEGLEHVGREGYQDVQEAAQEWLSHQWCSCGQLCRKQIDCCKCIGEGIADVGYR